MYFFASKIIFFVCWLFTSHGWDIKSYNPVANPNAIVNVTNARFTVLKNHLIRMEYDPSNKFEDRQSMAIVNRYFDNVPSFTHTISNGNLTIKTDDLTLIYKIGQPFGPNSLLINGNVDGFTFNYVTTGDPSTDNSNSQNLFGTIRSLDEITGPTSLNCTNADKLMIHGESLHCTWSLFGRNGYALLNDTNSSFMSNNWIDVNYANQNNQDWYFFGHGLNFAKAIYDFISISGNVPLVPRYTLGSMHCRWYDYSDLQLKQAVQNMESRQFPVDVAVIDMDWHIYGPWGAYTYNHDLLPRPNLTQSWFHHKGLRTSANLHDDNGISPSEQYYTEAAAALGVSDGDYIYFNVTSEEYMTVLEDIVLLPISEPVNVSIFDSNLTHGFDFWWIDWQQGGTPGIYYSTTNPTIMLNYVRSTDHIRRNNENIRGFVIARYGGYGNQRYPGSFSGDVGHTWSTLNFEPYFTSTASNVAYNYISHDIMGSAGDYELNTRWIQFGAYSPVFRTHDAGGGAGTCADKTNGCALVDIWTHPWKNFNIERKALQERSELLPYLYNASYTSYLTGLGITLPLYIKWGNEQSNSYNSNTQNQYIYGNNIESDNIMMVYPVTSASGNCNNPMGGCFNLTLQNNIWIPENTYWYEVHSGKYVNGTSGSSGNNNGVFMNKWFDISEIPIYIQSGAVIVKQPFDKYMVIGRANLEYYNHLLFDIYPDFGNNNDGSIDYTSDIWLYEDDGISMDYINQQTNNHVKTMFKYQFNVNNNQFIANISSVGTYRSFPSKRYYSISIRNVLPAMTDTVMCNNNKLNYNHLWYSSSNSNNDHDESWYYDSNKMAVIVNCGELNTNSMNTIKATFSQNWADDNKILNGIKGKINRAVLSKNNLDEANVEYGGTRINLTDAASYSTLLGDVGYDINQFVDLIDNFDNLYNGAINQVLNNINAPGACSVQRKMYSYSLLTTML